MYARSCMKLRRLYFWAFWQLYVFYNKQELYLISTIDNKGLEITSKIKHQVNRTQISLSALEVVHHYMFILECKSGVLLRYDTKTLSVATLDKGGDALKFGFTFSCLSVTKYICKVEANDALTTKVLHKLIKSTYCR